MNILELALFDPHLLAAMLYYWRQEAIGADWCWHYGLGYVDDLPRDAAWAKKIFGWN